MVLRIFKMVVTSGFLVTLECTKFGKLVNHKLGELAALFQIL